MQRIIPAAHLLLIVFGISVLFASCSGPVGLSNRHYGSGMYVKASKEKQKEGESTATTNGTTNERKILSLLPQRRAALSATPSPAYAQKRTAPANHWKQTTARASKKNNVKNGIATPAIASADQTTMFSPVTDNRLQTTDEIGGSGSFVLMIVGIVLMVLGAVFLLIVNVYVGVVLGLLGLVFVLLGLLL